jgi:hypothetical protein
MATKLTPELEEEIEQHPPAVQAVMRAHPPVTCYHDSANAKRGHYWIRSYINTRSTEDGSPGPVLICMVHGSDSFLPGMTVNGMNPTEISVCGCGQWKPATDDQLFYMQEHLSMLHLARCGATRPPDSGDGQLHMMRMRLVALHRMGSAFVTAIDSHTIAAAIKGAFKSDAVERTYADFRLALMMFAPPPGRTEAERTERKSLEPPYIRCKKCELKSHNPYDIGLRFCGRCNKFHEAEEEYELGPSTT